MQDLNEEIVRDSDQLKEFRGESNFNIHNDPITGYSTLLRPDKSQPTSTGQVAFYESVKIEEGFLQGGDNVTAHMNYQYSTLKQDPQPSLAISHTSSHYKVNSEEKSSIESVQSLSESISKGMLLTPPTAPTITHTIPTDPQTGYSSMLRPDKVVPPPGPVPLYDVINVKKQASFGPARSNSGRSK